MIPATMLPRLKPCISTACICISKDMRLRLRAFALVFGASIFGIILFECLLLAVRLRPQAVPSDSVISRSFRRLVNKLHYKRVFFSFCAKWPGLLSTWPAQYPLLEITMQVSETWCVP